MYKKFLSNTFSKWMLLMITKKKIIAENKILLLNLREEIRELLYHQYQALCFFLSHGSSKGCSDGEILPFEYIPTEFNHDKSNWKGIPKTLFFHCSRGDSYEYPDTGASPKYTDTLINYSTRSGM